MIIALRINKMICGKIFKLKEPWVDIMVLFLKSTPFNERHGSCFELSTFLVHAQKLLRKAQRHVTEEACQFIQLTCMM